MSREKTLQDFIIDLKFELEQLEKKRNEIQVVLKHAQEKYSCTTVSELKNINTSISPLNHYKSISTIDAALKYLTEQKRTCTTREIANSIINKGTRNRPESVLSTTSSALRKLSNQNKVVQISKGYWSLSENIIGVSNEHEKL